MDSFAKYVAVDAIVQGNNQVKTCGGSWPEYLTVLCWWKSRGHTYLPMHQDCEGISGCVDTEQIRK
ncbi:hypothetical protein EP396_23070 [Salmonella enterica subsp. enterica serovar Dublin]|nr:hypothetical protein [Salmonella enterica subsp. enterica serovar Dublin]